MIERREFLRAAGVAGAGLVVGVRLDARTQGRTDAPDAPFAPNAFVRVGTDGVVTVIVGYSEMGQGITTSLPMLVAEELEVDPSAVKFEQAPADPAYNNPDFGMQGTGGSSTIHGAFLPMRQAGAAAREMLVAAAAQRWGVSADSLTARGGVVTHAASNRRATYGELAMAAAALPVPANPALKSTAEFRVIGRRTKRNDAPAKVRGQARFGIDVRLPGMLTAVVARCPVFEGRVRSFSDTRARAVPGVRHVLQISNGVAVVADGYWAAKKGRDALDVTWDEGANANNSSAAITQEFTDAARNPGIMARHEGSGPGGLAGAARRVDAIYETPFLAHATMEPMNCTAHVRAGAVEIWAPTQFQTAAQGTAARIAGVPPAAVQVHTTFLGGGFGRRFEMDFIADAVELSKATHVPVQVVYSREDDIQHDMYRPATYNVLAAGLGADGMPVAWTHRAVGASIMTRAMPQAVPPGQPDPSSVEGAANLPYAIPNLHVDWVRAETGVPVGFWRSVGNSQNHFVTESFIDELAHAAGVDPLAYRIRLLQSPGAVRHLRALEAVAEQSQWRSPLPAGRARGVAVAESFGSVVAEVAEVSLNADGTPRVHRVVCVVDCGTAVNPLTIEAQMQSAIVYGLSAALRGAITIERGRVVQSNFHDYAPLRIDEMPHVEVHILPSSEPPTGVGEPGTPPIAPTVCNALFALTGKRIRRLPIRAEDLRQG
jgi:isoquinoline 1-oxidoreductase beta subunit